MIGNRAQVGRTRWSLSLSLSFSLSLPRSLSLPPTPLSSTPPPHPVSLSLVLARKTNVSGLRGRSANNCTSYCRVCQRDQATFAPFFCLFLFLFFFLSIFVPYLTDKSTGHCTACCYVEHTGPLIIVSITAMLTKRPAEYPIDCCYADRQSGQLLPRKLLRFRIRGSTRLHLVRSTCALLPVTIEN